MIMVFRARRWHGCERDTQVSQSVLMLFGVIGEEAREAVVRSLDEVPGVKEVYVNMYRAEAMITHDGRCTASDLAAAVNAAGAGCGAGAGQAAFHAQAVHAFPPFAARATIITSTNPKEPAMSKISTHTIASEIMTPEPVCAEPAMTIRQLARLFEENEISGCPVVDQEGRVIGVVSKTDLIRRCSEGTADQPPGYLFEVISEQGGEDGVVIPEPLICVQDFMSGGAVTVTPTTPAAKVAALMFESRIHRVVVVDEERFPVGIITSLDLLGTYPQ